MYDWTDNFTIQAQLSFIPLRFYIAQSVDLGDTEELIEMLLSMVSYTEANH